MSAKKITPEQSERRKKIREMLNDTGIETMDDLFLQRDHWRLLQMDLWRSSTTSCGTTNTITGPRKRTTTRFAVCKALCASVCNKSTAEGEITRQSKQPAVNSVFGNVLEAEQPLCFSKLII